jgi:hypothetical protein
MFATDAGDVSLLQAKKIVFTDADQSVEPDNSES